MGHTKSRNGSSFLGEWVTLFGRFFEPKKGDPLRPYFGWPVEIDRNSHYARSGQKENTCKQILYSDNIFVESTSALN